MKYLLIIAIAISSFSMNAQREEPRKEGPRHEMRKQRPDFTPEQIAELRTKRLTLDLDLSENQQSRMRTLQLELAKNGKAKKEGRKERKKLSSNDLFEMQKSRLDNQIAHKNEMKAILDANQFDKWEKGKRHMKEHHQMRRSKRRS